MYNNNIYICMFNVCVRVCMCMCVCVCIYAYISVGYLLIESVCTCAHKH